MGRYINWFVGFCFINLIEMGKDQHLAMENGRREWTEVEIGFFLNWRVPVWKNILEFEHHHFSRCFDCSFKIVWGYPVLWCVFQLEPQNSDTIPHCRQWLPRLLGLEWWTFCWLLTFICFKLGTKKPVCYEKIWDETMSFAGMVCPGRAIEERNETSPKNLRNSSPMLLGRLCCWRVFFLKVGAFVFTTPPEHGHETWILQSYTFSNMWTSLPCPFLGDWDVQNSHRERFGA